ncbi:hypothetical protein [Bordetella sp. N]|uniref:hypothetical protein n=1 Tax=Bordetella sp. N TaxID=1746199 RepID=UPI00070AA86B|nr:hypothetical protein [Bordetella sp. N]ALM83093.1 hypothetical protein ASB57_09135 [Bordetella sp. N]
MKPLLLRLAVCSIAFLPLAAPRAAEDPAAIQARLTEMSPGSQVACHADKYGNPDCKVDDFRVDYSGCDVEYGAVAVKGGVDLQDNINNRGGQTAHLHDRQFVCIAARARDSHDKYRYYVIAPPTAVVPDCKGKSICRDGDQPILWLGPYTGKMCDRTKAGEYIGDCASGWVDQGVLDEYSNGI